MVGRGRLSQHAVRPMSASIWRPLVVIIASVLTLGCASTVYNHPARTTGGTPTAELTVIRKSAFGGGLAPQTVSLDGEKLVRLWTGSYAVMWVAPNTYSLAVEYTSIDATVEVELRAGERTYILLEPELGWAVSGGVSVSNTGTTTSSSVLPLAIPVLHPIPEEHARELMGKYDLVGDIPEAFELREEISVSPLPHQKISHTQGGFSGLGAFSLAMASLGDLDGDGVGDLAARGPTGTGPHWTQREQGMWILFLNADGTVKSHQKISPTEGGFDATLGGLGATITSLGDLDGDGITEIANGHNGANDGGTGRGAAIVLFLNADGTVKSQQRISSTHGGFTGRLSDGDDFAIEVAFLGDFDGDGVPDMAAGARGDDDGGTNRGAVWVLFLNADGTVKSHQKISDTQGGFTGILDDYDIFGESVASLGDLDGDGVDDMAVSAAHDDDGGKNRGAVWILFLNADGTVKSHQKISDTQGGFTGLLMLLREYDDKGPNQYQWHVPRAW